jgi:integrase
MSDYLIRRGAFWTFFRRVPADYAELDRRNIVSQSTKVRTADDPKRQRARRVADKMNTALEAYWRDLAHGKAAGARQRYREATVRARRLGFDYMPTADLVAAPITELLRRIEMLEARGLVPPMPTPASIQATEALLGRVEQPRVMVSETFNEHLTLERANLGGKSGEQMRLWTNPRKAALADFMAALRGDKPLDALTRADTNAFRKWWSDRIEREGYSRDTANQQFGILRTMFEGVARANNLDLGTVFNGLRFKPEDKQRPAFDPDYIAQYLLAPGALDPLNDEARHAFYVTIETGMRPSEICGLNKPLIKLNDAVPHVIVMETSDREIKTKNSRREIPLVGVALKAMQYHPDGFTRYLLKPGNLSAAINRALEGAGLLPTPEHSFYSLRHSFKDRLRAIEPPGELIDMLMGHTSNKPKYGKGYTLEVKRKWLQRIALPVPSTV